MQEILEYLDPDMIEAYIYQLVQIIDGVDPRKVELLSIYDDQPWVLALADMLESNSETQIRYGDQTTAEFLMDHVTVMSVMDDILTALDRESVFKSAEVICRQQLACLADDVQYDGDDFSSTHSADEVLLEHQTGTLRNKYQALYSRFYQARQVMSAYKDALICSVFPEASWSDRLQEFDVRRVMRLPCVISDAVDRKLELENIGVRRTMTPGQRKIQKLFSETMQGASWEESAELRDLFAIYDL